MMRVISLLLLIIAPLVAEAHRLAPSGGRSPTVKYQLFGNPHKRPRTCPCSRSSQRSEALSETPWFPKDGKVLRQQWACAGESLEGLPWGFYWRRISRRW